MKYFLRCNHNGKTVISFSGLSKEPDLWRTRMTNSYVIISIGQLIQALRQAYITSCKALGLANKLGKSKHKSRILRRMNWIRQELTAYEKQIADAFVTIAYKGVILDKLAFGE